MSLPADVISARASHAPANPNAATPDVQAQLAANFSSLLSRAEQNPNAPTNLTSVVKGLLTELAGVTTEGDGTGTDGSGTDPSTPPAQPTDEYGPLAYLTVGDVSTSPDGTAWLTGTPSPGGYILPVLDDNGDPVILSDGRPLYQAVSGPGTDIATQ